MKTWQNENLERKPSRTKTWNENLSESFAVPHNVHNLLHAVALCCTFYRKCKLHWYSIVTPYFVASFHLKLDCTQSTRTHVLNFPFDSFVSRVVDCVLLVITLKGICHRYRYMNGWYGNVYHKAPPLSISIQIAQTKNMRLYCGQQCSTSNPVSCDIAPLSTLPYTSFSFYYCIWVWVRVCSLLVIVDTSFCFKSSLFCTLL